MFKKEKNISIVFPNEIWRKKKFENAFVTPLNPLVGVAAFTETKEPNVLRLYQLLKQEDGYHLTHELQAFNFPNKFNMTSFLQRLPEMTALEILMLMSPIQYVEQ